MSLDPIDPIDPIESPLSPGPIIVTLIPQLYFASGGNTNLMQLFDPNKGTTGALIVANSGPSWFAYQGTTAVYQRQILLEDGVTAFGIQNDALTLRIMPVLGGSAMTFTAVNLDDGTTPNKGKFQYVFQTGDIPSIPSGLNYVDYNVMVQGTKLDGTVYDAPVAAFDVIRFQAPI